MSPINFHFASNLSIAQVAFNLQVFLKCLHWAHGEEDID